MKPYLLLFTLASLYLMLSTVVGQQCTSNYVSGITAADAASSKASSLVCPTGSINGFSFTGNRTCISIPNTILPNYVGMSCAGSSSACQANWLGCAARTQTCEYRRTRILGDYCTHRENCVGSFGSASAYTNCVNNQCVSFKVLPVVNVEGGACLEKSLNETTNIVNDCAAGFYCYQGACLKMAYNSDEGGPCETISGGVRVFCKENSGLTCISNVCYKPTILQLGQNCSGLPVSTVCADGLYCRKENIDSAAKTCQKPSVYGEFCETASDCYKLPILQMRCAKNKCIRRWHLLDGEACDKNDDCFNNYCENLKCSSTVVTCSTAKACPSSSDLKCGCGGLSSASPFNGTCVQPCNGFREDFYACAYNNGVDELTSGMTSTISYQPVDANSTVITKLCSKQYANMIKCYKKAWTDAGMADVSALTTLSGLDVTGQPQIPTNLTLPVVGRNLTSPSPKVAVSVSLVFYASEATFITTSLPFVFALLFICLSFVL